MGLRHRPRRVFAEGFDPALPKPVGGVEPRRLLRLAKPVSLAGEAAQNGIGEPAIAPRGGCAQQRYRLVHSRVGRGAQEQDVGGAQPERVQRRCRAARQRPLDEDGEQGVDLAEAAERGRRQVSDQRPVARLERREAVRVGESLVQRAAMAEHGVEQRMRVLARSRSSEGFRAAHCRSALRGWQPGGCRA